MSKHFFLDSWKQNLKTAVLAFFKQENLSENLIHCLLKNITLLPAEKLGNINLYQQTVLLKIIYGFRIEISFIEKQIFYFKKTPFRYVFSIAIMYSCETVLVKVLVSKG